MAAHVTSGLCSVPRDKFCLGGLAEGAKATHYPQYLMEKTSKDLWILRLTWVTGKKLDLNTLMADHESLNAMISAVSKMLTLLLLKDQGTT